MTRVAIPALVVLTAVAALVATAAWNATDAAVLAITLTERELRLQASGDEDPVPQLRLTYHHRHDPLDARNWLPESRLRAIGFPLHVPVGAPQAADTYRHVPPRLAWVVFEYDGPAWRAIDRQWALREPTRPREPWIDSRLVPVDAGRDFEALRARYPSRHLILRGVIGLAYVPPPRGGPLVHGVLREVVPEQLAVRKGTRDVLDGLDPRVRPGEPRYEVDVAVGRLGLPYVRAIRRAEAN